MKKRIKRLLTTVGIFLTVGILYFILNRLTGFAIPCPLHFITGLHCPGCGISRMFICLFKLDFIGAIRQNVAVFIFLPLFLYFSVVLIIKYIKTGSLETSTKQNIVLYIVIGIFVLFGICRNIPVLDFLAPH